MTKQTFDINKLRVAAPCSVPWESMTGDERARHCDSCQLNVYNISEMSRAEVENLIGKSEGRICMRLYKRADGTVITKDCPVGIRVLQKRAARFAGAALATVLGLFSVSFGQKDDKKAVDAAKLKITRTISQETVLEGTITDPNGAVVPNAEILIFRGKINVATIRSDENGYYKISSLAPGIYALEAGGAGFMPYRVKNLKLNGKQSSVMNIELEVDENSRTIGVVICTRENAIDMGSTTIKTTITKDMMNRLPH